VGFVFQFFHLVPELTAWENALLPARLSGDLAAGRRRLRVLFERLALDRRAAQLPLDLSGGEQQRVAIARALVMEPRLLLADEPTGNLDEATGREVLSLLCSAVTAERALVMVTHNPEHAAAVDVRLELRDGRIVP
jgi:ABC-type lipoprotein export system ATPase subunit